MGRGGCECKRRCVLRGIPELRHALLELQKCSQNNPEASSPRAPNLSYSTQTLSTEMN